MPAEEKVIVVSDIHMSNGAGYSWFHGEYVNDVRAMFEQFAADPDITELVLLGDIFDLWLYPVNVQPWTARQIIQNLDPGILTALRNCVASVPHVYYLTGNHDMNVTPSDLRLLVPGDKQICWIRPEEYNAKHQTQWHLEHGHAADMFNAPDPAADTIGGYPLGFFITRLVASAEDQSAVWNALRKVISVVTGAHEMRPTREISISMGALVVGAIIVALEIAAEVPSDTLIRFSEPGLDNKYTVGDVKKHYWGLYDRWVAKYPVDLVRTMLAGLTKDGLDWYASLLLASTGVPVVVMGHTHYGEQNPASATGYDNSGCWCDASALGGPASLPTYVEIANGKATLIRWGS